MIPYVQEMNFDILNKLGWVWSQRFFLCSYVCSWSYQDGVRNEATSRNSSLAVLFSLLACFEKKK